MSGKKKTDALTVITKQSPPMDNVYTLKPVDGVKGMKFRRISLAPIVKLADMPVGGAIVGKLEGIQESPRKNIKSKLIRVTLTDGREVLLTGNRALTNVILREDGDKVTCPFIGKTVIVTRTGTRMSPNYKKNFPIFDVQVEE